MEQQEFFNSINKGGFFSLAIVTEPKMRKQGNPFFTEGLSENGRKVLVPNCKIEKHTSLTAIAAASYQKMIEKRATAENFVFEEDKVIKEWLIKNFIGAGANGVYMRYYFFPKKCNYKAYYTINGVIATTEQTETIKSFLSGVRPSMPEKFGIDDEERFETRSVNVEHIVYMKQGEREWKKD
jgi:hypothetical protein